MEIDASSHVPTSHQLEDTKLEKATLEGTMRFRLRRCRFRPGYVYTRRPHCESKRPRCALELLLVPSLAWTLEDRDTLHHLRRRVVSGLHVR
jgi:hypothetical protein